MSAGRRRTYFFDVRQTKGDDYYLTLTESTKRFDGEGTERHKIFLYKEDFNRFVASLEEVIAYVKTELMPDFDYEEFDRIHDEWESRDAAAGPYERPPQSRQNNRPVDQQFEESPHQAQKPAPPSAPPPQIDDDLSW